MSAKAIREAKRKRKAFFKHHSETTGQKPDKYYKRENLL